MNQVKLYVGLLVLVLFGCSPDDATPKNKAGSGIVGRWRLFRLNGSNGASDFVTPISAKPLQALTFTNQGRVSKEGSQLSDYYDRPFYRVDSASAYRQLWFLASEKDTIGYVVGLVIRGDTMHLIPPCYEGCGASFVRID